MFRSLLVILLLLSSQLTWAHEDFSYSFRRNGDQIEHALWYQHIARKIFVDLRYDYRPGVFECLFGKYIGLDSTDTWSITPAVGVVRGISEGVSAETYFFGKLIGVSIFSLYQVSFSTAGGNHWGYEFLELSHGVWEKPFNVRLGVAQEAYREFTDAFRTAVTIGPSAAIASGRWYFKPCYGWGIAQDSQNQFILIIGCQF